MSCPAATISLHIGDLLMTASSRRTWNIVNSMPRTDMFGTSHTPERGECD